MTKLYSFKIYESGKIVRDFVPVIKAGTNEGGMYDFVTRKFYGNKGSGLFGFGPEYCEELPAEYEQLSYIENSGGAYIDTELYEDKQFEVDAIFQNKHQECPHIPHTMP